MKRILLTAIVMTLTMQAQAATKAIESITITGGDFGMGAPAPADCTTATAFSNYQCITGTPTYTDGDGDYLNTTGLTAMFNFFNSPVSVFLGATATGAAPANDWDYGFQGSADDIANTITMNMGGWYAQWSGTNFLQGTDSSGVEQCAGDPVVCNTSSVAATGTVNMIAGTFDITWSSFITTAPFAGQTGYWHLTGTVVFDETAPVITLTGPATVTTGTSDTYTDAGATATDNVDNIVTVNTSGAVIQAVPGDYTLTYNATDISGNVATPVTRTVTVVDNTPPVITLTGSASVSVGAGSTYSDLGATASDNWDGDITTSIVTVNPVNTSIPGVYTVTYNVNDAASNSAIEVTRTVTVTNGEPPVITLAGSATVDINEGDTYTDAGATASDPEDGDRTAFITTVNSVNTATPGIYTVTYNVVDSVGNPATEVTRTVTVHDITPPVITLTGSATVTTGTSDTYTDAGATASDNFDSSVTVLTSGTINQAVPGDYILTYTASDAAGNAATPVIRTVTVVDNTPPVITLTGSAAISVAAGLGYTDAGATATDNIDGNISANIVLGGDTVNTSVPGTYIITYNVSDTEGNAATEVTRTVTVTVGNPPVITLTGNAYVYLNEGDTYVDAGATASDIEDGIIDPASIIVVNPVNTAVPDVYTITYNVNDSAGNPATQVTRIVTVYESSIVLASTPPVLTASQNGGTNSRIIVTTNGDVTISTDLTGSNTFDWSATTQVAELNSITDAETFTFDPSGLADGIYEIKVTVNASTNNEASGSLLLRVLTSAPTLTTADSDGDGVDDLTEGFADTDGDGIADYLDDSTLLVNQLSTGNNYIVSSTGTLRLGNTSFAAGGMSALINSSDVADFGGSGASAVSNATDTQVKNACVGGCFDFEVIGLTQGETIQVVIPLNADIPSNPIYRIYTQARGWHDFEISGNDAIASSGTVNGICPDYNATSRWIDGLFPGDRCIRLTIQDGGFNDKDGVANGIIVDPSGVAQDKPYVPNEADGCSMTYANTQANHHADWLLIAGFIAMLGWFNITRRKV